MEQTAPRPKQVIVMRTDLGMRKGKMMAQAAHASMMFLQSKFLLYADGEKYYVDDANLDEFSEEEYKWFQGEYAKISVGIGSEEELLALLEKAKEAGLTAHLVTDNGHTEFDGVKTNTCICIGPHYPEKFVGLTDHLKLL